MNFKKIVTVLALLTVTDYALVSCSDRSKVHAYEANSAPVAEARALISPYDPIMREVAHEEGLDWRWLAAIAYQESRFNADIRSSRGAQGLMQVMGSVAKAFGVSAEKIRDPKINVETAVKLIKRIESSLRFGKNTSEKDRLRIVLACYNGGIGHIMDARRLAAKSGVDHNSWEQLRRYVTLKGTPEWVNDEAVRYGAFNGRETVDFVSKVMNQYEQYCKKYI